MKVILLYGTFFGVHCPHMTSLSTYERVNIQKLVGIWDFVHGWLGVCVSPCPRKTSSTVHCLCV